MRPTVPDTRVAILEISDSPALRDGDTPLKISALLSPQFGRLYRLARSINANTEIYHPRNDFFIAFIYKLVKIPQQ